MRKKFLGAVVLLLSAILVFSTFAVTAETNEEMNKSCIKTTNTNPVVNPTQQQSLGPVIFSQLPYDPDAEWSFYTSALGAGYICADDFYDLTDPICDIHWWGLSLVYPWAACDPNGMCFEIIFYDLNWDPVCVYTNVCPTPQPTGLFYSGFEMYYWEYDLDPCCPLTEGWVSIQSISSPNDCWFLWAGSPDGNLNGLQDTGTGWTDLLDSLAFELTTEDGPCEPCVDVEKYVWDDKNQEWIDADTENTALDRAIGTDITFKIVIHNCGDDVLDYIVVNDKMHDSLEYISGDPDPDEVYYEEPFWYMTWVFPGPLAPCETIEVYITAKVLGPHCSYDFNYVLVEAEGCGSAAVDDDYCWVHAVKVGKPANIPFFAWLESHPNMFPMLKLLLKLVGLF